MRVVVQRVSEASVDVINELGTLDPTFESPQIGPGFMILVGVTDEDGDQQIAWLTHKILNLRVFEDEQGKMNRSIQDIGGEILSISQFTLFADVHKGNRPSWVFMASARASMMGGKMAPPIRPMSIRPEISFWRSGRYSVINHLFLGMAHAGRQGLASAGTSLSQREHEPKKAGKVWPIGRCCRRLTCLRQRGSQASQPDIPAKRRPECTRRRRC